MHPAVLACLDAVFGLVVTVPKTTEGGIQPVFWGFFREPGQTTLRRGSTFPVWGSKTPGKTCRDAPTLGARLRLFEATTDVIQLLLRARLLILGSVVALLVVLLASGKRVDYEQSIRSFFAENDPDILTYNRASAAFGDDNFAFVVYDDPNLLTAQGMDRVAELAAELGPQNIEGVLRVESIDAMPLLWAVDDGLLAMDKLPTLLRNAALKRMKEAIKNVNLSGSSALSVGGYVRSADTASLLKLKSRLTAHPLFRGTLIDAEAKATSLVVRLKKTEEHDVKASVLKIRSRADAFAERHKLGRVGIVGPPVLLADGFNSIDVDGKRLAIVGMVLIGVVTLSATQSLWWALVPLMTGWVVWLAAEWILSTFNLRLSLSGGPLVAQIIVLTMPAASHLAVHFRDERRREGNPWTAARTTMAVVASPVLWCAITGAIGYGALVTSNVVPIRQFGWIMGLCTLMASLLVLVISPSAMLPPFRLDIPTREGSVSKVGREMGRVTEWVFHHPLRIVLGLVAIVIPISAGMIHLSYETNYINAFKPETRVVRDYQFVESKLGGIGVVEVVAPIPEKLTSATLEKFKRIEQEATDSGPDGQKPSASYVLSLATVLDPDQRFQALSAEAADRVLSAKLELIAASPQAELLRGFWNPETHQTRILVRLVEQQPSPRKNAIFETVMAATTQAFGPESFLTGLSFLMTKTTQGVIRTQWTTFFWSVAGILLMLTFALRRLTLAGLAMLPTLLAVALVLGLMGWLGIKLDMATALVASVALGLSVDDTFHCLLQFHRYRRTEPFRPSLYASYKVTGPGVLLSSSAVAVGFLALRLSEFVPFSNFGAMVAIATGGSTLGNILLLPACLTLGDRWSQRRASTSKTSTITQAAPTAVAQTETSEPQPASE